MEIKQWLFLDDIVYSTQYTLAKMVCDFVADNLKNIDSFTGDDRVKFYLLYEAVAMMINEDVHAVSNVTLKNKILTRTSTKFIELIDGMEDWLLERIPEDYKVETITSIISALVGQTKVVYDNTNNIELIVMNALGLDEKINPTQLFTIDEMYEALDKQVETIGSKENRDSIFTANKEVIERYANKLSIFIPKNFAHCRVKGADNFVEAWVLDEDEAFKKPETNK